MPVGCRGGGRGRGGVAGWLWTHCHATGNITVTTLVGRNASHVSKAPWHYIVPIYCMHTANNFAGDNIFFCGCLLNLNSQCCVIVDSCSFGSEFRRSILLTTLRIQILLSIDDGYKILSWILISKIILVFKSTTYLKSGSELVLTVLVGGWSSGPRPARIARI